MLRLYRPTPRQIDRYLERQGRLDLSYAHVGATRLGDEALAQTIGSDFVIDRNRVRIGEGRACFQQACAALAAWRMFSVPGIRVCGAAGPLEVGRTVAVLTRALGLYTLNPCRILEVFDEPGPPGRFGFAYGTLPGHVACGEERFRVTLQADEDVWYEICAFSRPSHAWLRLATPYFRHRQRAFARGSLHAMSLAVAEGARVSTHGRDDASRHAES